MNRENSLALQYWEDEADAIRRDEGTLLPLWKFDCSLTKEKQVMLRRHHKLYHFICSLFA